MTDERLNKLGNYFTHHNIYKRFGITFKQFMHMVKIGTWEDYITSRQEQTS